MRSIRAMRTYFRRRFWWSLLTVPVVVTSPMVMDWFGYQLDFTGIDWIGPVLGSVIFFWCGWAFLSGAWAEIQQRQPGMMLLVRDEAISVAYAASLPTAIRMVRPRVLVGAINPRHDHVARPLARNDRPRGGAIALADLAQLLPDEAERSTMTTASPSSASIPLQSATG